MDRTVQTFYAAAMIDRSVQEYQPATKQGRTTRQRILAAAAELMHQRGVAGTSLDDVRAATATSKSQLYHYFDGKQALVHAVIAYQLGRVIAAQRPQIDRLDSVEALRRWAARVVELNRQAASAGGCPLGGLASELSDSDPGARRAMTLAFDDWQQHLSRGLAAMDLPAEADHEAIALGLLAALQGGLLLAQVQRSSQPLEIALENAIRGIEALTVTGSP